MSEINNLVHAYIPTIRSVGITEFLFLLSMIFDLSVHFVLVTLCVAYLVYYLRGKNYTILFLGSILLGMIVTTIIKYVSNVNRPPDALIYAFGKSFPSWHATVATIFFVMLMYIFDDLENHYVRIGFNILCILAIFMVSFSRIYLGVHWVSDVSFGILLGCIVSGTSVYMHKTYYSLR